MCSKHVGITNYCQASLTRSECWRAENSQ